MTNILVLIRHGQSTWNKKNIFTGQKNARLTSEGQHEAFNAGTQLRYIMFGAVFSSSLIRAFSTAKIILENNHFEVPKITKHEELNERDYGDLIGMNKTAVIEKYGKEIVHRWRRSYDIAPPGGESLKDTYNRVVPFYVEKIRPKLDNGNVLVSAHGNSLRALIKFIDNISNMKIEELEIKTGKPIIYPIDRL